jgi:hypothetical protein
MPVDTPYYLLDTLNCLKYLMRGVSALSRPIVGAKDGAMAGIVVFQKNG